MEPKVLIDSNFSPLTLPLPLPLEWQAPALRLLNALISKGIVDPFGVVNPFMHTVSGTFVEIFNERMEAFLCQTRKLRSNELDLEIELSVHEILEALKTVEPAINIEVFKKNALYFLGFQAIDETFKSWGIDLVEICGGPFVDMLREEIETPPPFLFIQYFIEQRNSIAIAKLNSLVRDLISSKLPLYDLDPTYKETKSKVLELLCQKPDRQYSEWIQGLATIDLHICNIVACEFFIKNQIDPIKKSPEPFGGITLEFDNGPSIEFEFSHSVPLSKQRSSSDIIHLPATSGLSKQELQRYDVQLLQGMIDCVCKNNTLVSFSPTWMNWVQHLEDTVQGLTCRVPSFNLYLMENLLQEAFSFQKLYPKLSFGGILANYLERGCKKKQTENADILHPESMMALTIAACESLYDKIPLQELYQFIETLSLYWINLAEPLEDPSIYTVLAQVLQAKVPYPLISAILQLGCYHRFHTYATSDKTSLWLNYSGLNEKMKMGLQLEESVQLEIHEQQRLYLTVKNAPFQTTISLMEYAQVQKEHLPLLNALYNQIIGSHHPSFSFENTWIPHLELFLPKLLTHLVHLLQKQMDGDKRQIYLHQFLDLLQSQNQLISNEEREQISIELEKISVESTSDLYIYPLLKILGSSDNESLNQALYHLFKEHKSSKLQSVLAKALCGGKIPLAIKTFIHLSRSKNTSYEFLEKLLKKICKNLKQVDSETLLPYLEFLRPEVESLKFKSSSIHWLKEHLSIHSEKKSTARRKKQSVDVPAQITEDATLKKLLSSVEHSIDNIQELLSKRVRNQILQKMDQLTHFLLKNNDPEAIVSVIHCLIIQHALPLKDTCFHDLLSAIELCLAKSEIHSQKITDLLLAPTLQDLWEIGSPTRLTAIYEILSRFYLDSHFEKALQIGKKRFSVDVSADTDLFILLLNLCGEQKKLAAFTEITQYLSIPLNEEVKECWKKNFEILYSSQEQDEYHEQQLLSLSELVKLKVFPDLIQNPSFLLKKLVSTKSYSPHFQKALNIALKIVPFLNEDKNLIIEFYRMLKFTANPELSIRALEILKSRNDLSTKEKRLCFHTLLEGIRHFQSDLFLEILKYPSEFPLLDWNHPENRSGCIILFLNLKDFWKKYYSHKVLIQFKKLYRTLETKWLTNPTEEIIQIKKNYICCLSMSPRVKDQQDALNTLIAILTEHFNTPTVEWTLDLLEITQRVLKNLLNSEIQSIHFHPFVQLLSQHPHHKVGSLIISKQMKEKSATANLSSMTTILFALLQSAPKLDPRNFLEFKRFCIKINLKSLFQKMLTFVEREQNTLVFQCLTLDVTKQIIDPKWVSTHQFKASDNLLAYFVNNFTYDSDILQSISHLIPNWFRTKLEEEFKDLFLKFLHVLLIESSKKADHKSFLNYIHTLNRSLTLWTPKEQDVEEYPSEPFYVSDLFIQFSKNLIRFYYESDPSMSLAQILMFVAGTLLKGTKNKSFTNYIPFAEVLVGFGFLISEFCKQINIDNDYTGVVSKFPYIVLDSFSNSTKTEILALTSALHYYLQETRQEGSVMIFDVFKGNVHNPLLHELMLLLKIKDSEIIIAMIVNILDRNIQAFVPSYMPFFKLLKMLAIYTGELHSNLQGLFFAKIAKIHLRFTEVAFINGTENACYMAFENSLFENFAQISKRFFIVNKKQQSDILIDYFQDIVATYFIFLIKKMPIFLTSIKNFKNLCLDNLKQRTQIDGSFNKIALSFANIFFLSMNIKVPGDFVTMRVKFIVEWIKEILEIGQKLNQSEQAMELCKSLIKLANSVSLFKGFPQEFKEILLILNPQS